MCSGDLSCGASYVTIIHADREGRCNFVKFLKFIFSTANNNSICQLIKNLDLLSSYPVKRQLFRAPGYKMLIAVTTSCGT